MWWMVMSSFQMFVDKVRGDGIMDPLTRNHSNLIPGARTIDE